MADPSESLQQALRDLYMVEGPLGRGGMGEVWSVRDPELRRRLALKVLRVEGDADAESRFLAEAQLTAQLEHPGVVPIHARGELPDGRPYFTMKEVNGRTLAEVLATGTAPLRRLVEALVRVAETAAYAHARGVVHRDIKPANIMLGDFGAVLLLDWGLASLSTTETNVETDRADLGAFATRVGRVAGTPAYMPPEQARGIAGLGPRADVYALGAVLYEILSGRPPFSGSASEVLAAVLAGPPAPLPADAPPELAALCARAMARDPEARYRDASELADALRAWMDGAHRRELALAHVLEADRIASSIPEMRAEAASLRRRATGVLTTVGPHASTAGKAEAWRAEDAAARLEQDAWVAEEEVVRALQAALTHAPDLDEAHAQLAEVYRQRHARAEEGGDAVAARAFAQRLRDHDRTGRHTAWLAGDGTLTLTTEPSGAEVWLRPLVLEDRRWIPGPAQRIGTTPLHAPLGMGRWLCELRLSDRPATVYPVYIRRAETWVAEGVRLPRLAPEERYVPGGWFLSGDPEARNGRPVSRTWLDGFVARARPVTNREFICFLDDLVATGRGPDAERFVPREPVSDPHLPALPIFGRASDGRFVLRPDATGDLWEPDWPVLLVDWHAAAAFAAWEAEKTGLPWRLPTADEREKMARGVDGRRYPWGDFPEPTWANGAGARPGRPRPVGVQEFPEDVSIYGIFGLAGNSRDWCTGACPGDEKGWKPYRGGAWSAGLAASRAADIMSAPPEFRSALVGIRLARNLVPTDFEVKGR